MNNLLTEQTENNNNRYRDPRPAPEYQVLLIFKNKENESKLAKVIKQADIETYHDWKVEDKSMVAINNERLTSDLSEYIVDDNNLDDLEHKYLNEVEETAYIRYEGDDWLSCKLSDILPYILGRKVLRKSIEDLCANSKKNYKNSSRNNSGNSNSNNRNKNKSKSKRNNNRNKNGNNTAATKTNTNSEQSQVNVEQPTQVNVEQAQSNTTTNAKNNKSDLAPNNSGSQNPLNATNPTNNARRAAVNIQNPPNARANNINNKKNKGSNNSNVAKHLAEL